jgi:hypothetical protein
MLNSSIAKRMMGMRRASWMIVIASFLIVSGTAWADENKHGEHTTKATSSQSVPVKEVGTGGHRHGGDVEESPVNTKVIGAFAAVNAAFLIYGVFRKYGAKREGRLS